MGEEDKPLGLFSSALWNKPLVEDAILPGYDFRSRMTASHTGISAAGLGKACREHVPLTLSYTDPKTGQVVKYCALIQDVEQDLMPHGGENVRMNLVLTAVRVEEPKPPTWGGAPKKGPTVAKHKITSIANPLTKSIDVYVEVLKDGKSQEPEQYLRNVSDDAPGTLPREEGQPMPVYASYSREFAGLLGRSLTDEFGATNR